MLPLMWVCLVIIGGVSLFGINFQVPFAKESGFGPFVVASSAGVLSVINGTGRGLVGWISDYIGRKQTLALVLLIAGVAQFGVLWSGRTHDLPLFMVFAFLNGFGGGAFYPMFAALVPDYGLVLRPGPPSPLKPPRSWSCGCPFLVLRPFGGEQQLQDRRKGGGGGYSWGRGAARFILYTKDGRLVCGLRFSAPERSVPTSVRPCTARASRCT
jgi:hypothetical protein